jgi:hypothetical protein
MRNLAFAISGMRPYQKINRKVQEASDGESIRALFTTAVEVLLFLGIKHHVDRKLPTFRKVWLGAPTTTTKVGSSETLTILPIHTASHDDDSNPHTL